VVSWLLFLGDLQGTWRNTLKSGVDNNEIQQLTDQFEGSLIRVFRRLGELLRQMAQAAKVIGNSELKEKFEKSSEMLERPNSVIFCSSLYL
jgi:ATP-dependent RNA helicase DOB1